jgi:hypothetical protein
VAVDAKPRVSGIEPRRAPRERHPTARPPGLVALFASLALTRPLQASLVFAAGSPYLLVSPGPGTLAR